MHLNQCIETKTYPNMHSSPAAQAVNSSNMKELGEGAQYIFPAKDRRYTQYYPALRNTYVIHLS